MGVGEKFGRNVKMPSREEETRETEGDLDTELRQETGRGRGTDKSPWKGKREHECPVSDMSDTEN